jgi:hypothetical protein
MNAPEERTKQILDAVRERLPLYLRDQPIPWHAAQWSYVSVIAPQIDPPVCFELPECSMFATHRRDLVATLRFITDHPQLVNVAWMLDHCWSYDYPRNEECWYHSTEELPPAERRAENERNLATMFYDFFVKDVGGSNNAFLYWYLRRYNPTQSHSIDKPDQPDPVTLSQVAWLSDLKYYDTIEWHELEQRRLQNQSSTRSRLLPITDAAASSSCSSSSATPAC